MNKIERQIQAIQKAIASGKVKNIYAAKGKIVYLQKQIKAKQYQNYLAQ